MGAALDLLSESPEAGRPCPRKKFPGLRRLLLPTTRYHLYYLYDPDRQEVLLLAIWSAVRGRGPKLSGL